MRAGGLVARRALTQLPLLAAVLAVLVAGATLVGLCALLLTSARDAAVLAAVRAAPEPDVRLSVAFRVTADGPPTAADPAAGTDPADPAGPVAVASAAAEERLAPLGSSSTSAWLTSPVLPVTTGEAGGDPAGQAYLLAADDVAAHARLVEGRWPDAAGGAGGATAPGDATEVAVPASAATALDVGVGDTLALEVADGVDLALRVVGVFRPVGPGTGAWERDVLDGAGHDPAWAEPGVADAPAPTSGPFVVGEAGAGTGVLGTAVPVDRVSMWLTPDLSGATPAELTTVRAGLSHVDRELTALLGGDAGSVAALSRLSRTLGRAELQADVTGEVVLVVGVVGFALAVAALALAGRLLVVRRAALAALLVARGARRSQLVRQSAAEAVVLAAVGGGLAVPLALQAYGAVLRAPALGAADLGGAAGPDGVLVGACAAAAVLLALVLVLPWLRRGDRARRRTTRARRGTLARSGADLAALALAVAAYLQLRRHLVVTEGDADPVLVAAPVAFLVAGALVALRVVPLVERLAERHAARSRRLVLPLAEWQVARRTHSAGVAFLLVLATAAATFGVAFAATWGTSQRDQADARVGADVVVHAASAGLPAGRDVAAAADADPVPAGVVQIGLGTDVGGRGYAASLVAFDTRRAEVVRGRLPGGATWASVTAGMAPEPVAGLPLDLAAGDVVVTATADRAAALAVVPTLVVEDAWGGRSVVRGGPVPLDGAEHAVVPEPGATVPDGELALVAVDLGFRSTATPVSGDRVGMVDVAVTVRTQAPAGTGGAADWHVRQTEQYYPWFYEGTAAVTGPGVLDVAGRVNLAGLWGTTSVVASPFPTGAVADLVVTSDVAEALGLDPGDSFTVAVGAVRVLGKVRDVVPYVPAAETGSAVLVDGDALSRALVLGGSLDPLTDRWWVATADPAGAAGRLAAAGLGDVQARDDVAAELRAGPLRVGVVVALVVLVVAAVVLALAGTGLDTAAALEARAVEVARLQGLGVSRRATLASLLAEHAAVTTVVVAAGAGVGAAAARLVGPLLAVSEIGQAPVPPALPVWPWPVQGAVLALLLVGSAAVAAPAAAALVRRAAVRHLRVGDP